MAVRAVIIAVEKYPNMNAAGLAGELTGTLADAEKFRSWLINVKKVDPANIIFCANPTKNEIAVAFRDLVDRGRDVTEELYVFYSGHGFTYTDSLRKQRPADVLVGSEFDNQRDGGNACLKLAEITNALDLCMGPGTHYYFIDACRNDVSATAAEPGVLGWRRDSSNLGSPSAFVMFSTVRNNFADLNSGFAPGMVDGLGGRGRAKRRDRLEWWVSFDSLRSYLVDGLSQTIQVVPGDGPGRILKVDPVKPSRCTIEITNAAADDSFTAIVTNSAGQQIGAPIQFQGRSGQFDQPPDDYFVQVTHPSFWVTPDQPTAADLFEDLTLKFEKAGVKEAPPGDAVIAVGAALLAPATVPVSLSAPSGTSVEITNLQTGHVTETPVNVTGDLDLKLDSGSYAVKLREPGWTSVRNLQLAVDPLGIGGPEFQGAAGERPRVALGSKGGRIDLGKRDESPLRSGILSLVPGAHDPDKADFSEQLGPMVNQDLGLWLAIMGASRIIGPSHFEKLQALTALASFDDVQPGDAPVYVMAAMEDIAGVINVAVHAPSAPIANWVPMLPVAGIPGFFHLRVNTTSGPHLVRIQAPNRAPISTVAYSLPNRATLFTVSSDPDTGISINQYMLPLERLVSSLSSAEIGGQPPSILRAVRFMTLAQKQVARKRAARPPDATEDRDAWQNLLYGKWLDPVMGLLACYELARNSRSPDAQMLPVALGNLRTYFSALPDVELIAKLVGMPHTEPQGLPLCFAGLHAMDHPEAVMPLPANRLEFTGPWITWLGV